MAKLVILNQGLSGHSYDLKVGRTTIGRVDDNSFEISDPSVSSHHCEIHWRGDDAKELFFRDLGSTNGSFINGERITEGVVTPGQTLRLGYVELNFVAEADGAAPAPSAAAAASAPAPSVSSAPPPPPPPVSPPPPAPNAPPPPQKKKMTEGTLVIPRGVNLSELEQGGTKSGGFNNTTIFSKKKKNPNKIFVIVGIIFGVIILVLIIVALILVNSGHR
jgi:pSer/pThr/pTyr-binding forkhead associated (FHA) protein